MRGIALLSGQPPGFSLGGTATVIFLGTLYGFVGGLVFVGLRFLVRTRRFLRAAVFWALLVLVTLRGLRPINADRLLLFVPLVIVYGATLHFLWCRVYGRRRWSAPIPSAAGAAPSGEALIPEAHRDR